MQQAAMVQPEPEAQQRPRLAVVAWPDAAPPQPEARAQHKQVSPPPSGPQPGRRARAEPVQPQALEQQLEPVQRASLPAEAEPRQVSPQLAALPGGVAAEPRPLPSSA